MLASSLLSGDLKQSFVSQALDKYLQDASLRRTRFQSGLPSLMSAGGFLRQFPSRWLTPQAMWFCQLQSNGSFPMCQPNPGFKGTLRCSMRSLTQHYYAFKEE